MASSSLCTVTIDDQEFVATREGDVLRVGPAGSDELAETVSLNHLPDAARTALDNGDTDNVALQQAVEGIARAIATRGG
jgi:hypothetical protein